MTLGQRLSSARKRYLRRPTRVLLRRYLILKAKRAAGRGDALAGFDRRMCGYYRGVSWNVNEGCRRAIVRGYAAGLVPTSTTGGRHAPGSFHKRRNARGQGQAVDLGVVEHEAGTAAGRARMVAFQAAEHRRHRAGHGNIGGQNLIELIGPDNSLIVLRDRESDLAEGSTLEQQHDTHVHEAYLG